LLVEFLNKISMKTHYEYTKMNSSDLANCFFENILKKEVNDLEEKGKKKNIFNNNNK
jgi:hypothetical protein